MPSVLPSVEMFRKARERLSGKIHHTPLARSTRLAALYDVDLFLKCEHLQKTGSFKPRGALNNVLERNTVGQARRVVTVSAGNHAQALAWVAQQLSIPCTVVMPATASPAKAAASRDYGAEVVLHGTVHEAFARAHEIEQRDGALFVHPFDDERTVAGHGSAAAEILEDLDDVAAIVVPIGGGGYISGIASYVRRVASHVKVFGVEPKGANAMRQSLDADRPVQLSSVSTIADGLAPPMVGELNFAIVREAVEDVVTVSDAEIARAMRDLATFPKVFAEPSGAAALAGLAHLKDRLAPKSKVVAIVSGGNVDPHDFSRLLGAQD